MNLKLVCLICLMMLTLVSSCGKKTQENNSPTTETLTPSDTEILAEANRDLRKAIVANDLNAFKRVLEDSPHADLNKMMNFDGETFLTYAISNDYADFRIFLLEKDVSINQPNVNRETPLITAVKKNKINVAKIFLDLKAEINSKTVQSDTALHIALKNKNQDMAIMLINHGANIYLLDKKDHSAVKLAIDNKLTEVVELINGITQIDSSAPDLATYRNTLIKGDISNLNFMVGRFPNIVIDYESINPLALVLDIKDEDTAIRSVRILLDHRANINGPKNAEVTPLIEAVKRKRKYMADLYLNSFAADPDGRDGESKTALIHAVEMNDLELTDLLLNKNAVDSYSYRKDNKRITVNACSIAKKMERTLRDQAQKNINKQIQKSLKCTILSRFL